MVAGHYAAAFLARPHVKTAPFWLLLLCANLAEFFWLLLALAGVEPTSPSSLFDASFQGLKVDMIYSHNLVPNLILGLLVFLFVILKYKDRKLALWCALLTCLHVWCDYIVGFEHQVLGKDSPSIGLNSYLHFPYLAIGIELLFAYLCLIYYFLADYKSGDSRSGVTDAAVIFESEGRDKWVSW